jgi:hypothetical protein
VASWETFRGHENLRTIRQNEADRDAVVGFLKEDASVVCDYLVVSVSASELRARCTTDHQC